MANFKHYWEEVTDDYVDALDNKYHKHRLEVIGRLLPNELFKAKKILDFGCGDAVLFPKFLKSGVDIFGVDPCPEIIELGRKRLKKGGFKQDIIHIGAVDFFKKIPANSLDAIFCFNVLAYLTAKEEKKFYEEAKRVTKKGGYLAVSHSNELFDMFSLNEYTVEFFKKNFNVNIKSLLKNVKKRNFVYNIRENPLTYRYKLSKYGFEEIKQEFSHLHPAPPALLKKEDFYNTNFEESQKWKLAFMCSTYMSLSQKK